MKLFRKILFWLHLTAGVVAGAVILTMCVTGVLLTYEAQTLEFAEREMRFVAAPAENSARLPPTEILAKVKAAKLNSKPSALTMQNDPRAAVNVALGRDGQVFVNPHTGAITGEGATGWRAFFRTVTDLHRWLALSGENRAVGKAITGACNLAFLFLAISGLYLWLPRRFSWQHLKPVLWFRGGLRGRARDFNWHNVIGFWSALALVVLTVTAAVISYGWANNLLYVLTGNEPPQQQQQQQPAGEQPFSVPENLNELWARAEAQAPGWKSISMRFPVSNDRAAFTIDEGKYLNRFGRSTLTLDAKTAEAVKWETYAEQNAGRQLRSWMRFTHTGETFGVVGQTIAGLASLGGAFLVWTGLALSLRRLRRWLSKRAESNSAAENAPDSQ